MADGSQAVDPWRSHSPQRVSGTRRVEGVAVSRKVVTCITLRERAAGQAVSHDRSHF